MNRTSCFCGPANLQFSIPNYQLSINRVGATGNWDQELIKIKIKIRIMRGRFMERCACGLKSSFLPEAREMLKV
jgi:hypothetical protein